jgi:hypothetical protein
MTVQLDEALIIQAKRTPRADGLTLEERIALNLFWRRDVRVPVLAKVFQCSKNTIYYNCLTGEAASYPSGHKAKEVNDLIDKMGPEKAWAKYVTEDMIRAVNAANKELVARAGLGFKVDHRAA